MNALTRQQVWQGDTRGKHSHPHSTTVRLGALFFKHLKCFGSAVVSDDNPPVCLTNLLLPSTLGVVLVGRRRVFTTENLERS